MVNTDNVIVPTVIMNKLVALADVVMGGGGDGDAAKRTAQEARKYINNNGCEYYKPLQTQIAELDTIGKCNIVQGWLDERKEQIRADIEKKALG